MVSFYCVIYSMYCSMSRGPRWNLTSAVSKTDESSITRESFLGENIKNISPHTACASYLFVLILHSSKIPAHSHSENCMIQIYVCFLQIHLIWFVLNLDRKKTSIGLYKYIWRRGIINLPHSKHMAKYLIGHTCNHHTTREQQDVLWSAWIH